MATTPSTLQKGTTEPGKDSRSKKQLRKDHITGIIALVVVVAMMALMIWLATLGNGESGGGYDYWPMTP